MQAQQASVRTGYVAGEFLTRTYRLSGEAPLRGEPLLDQLNDVNVQFLTLERMFVSPLHDPAILTGHFRAGEVRKNRVGIIVLKQKRDGLPLREGRYVGPDHVNHDVLFVSAGFEVRGTLSLHRTVHAPNFVRTTTEDFIPVFDATATLASRRDIIFKGGAILVNRLLTEVFAMLATEDA